jgi:predicted ATP-grasp superfamily ATP-dependent carboligase
MPTTSPILLLNGGYYGTLAAARALGAQGTPVYVAERRLLAVARWSRHVARVLDCPPFEETHRFIEWLLALGAREPGIVLYPTSDEATFIYSRYRDELSRYFHMYQPDIDPVLHVLDKKRLYATARAVGMDVPDTWFPESEADVARIAEEVAMPLLVKPRTQVLSRTHSKGVVVHDPRELVARWSAFVEWNGFHRALTDVMPNARAAMLQRYVAGAADRIYVLAAFIDRKGDLFAARSGVKVLQRPRRLGIGLCFEPAEIDPAVVEMARELALATGWYGLFQIELIRDGDRMMLIDFNPRFYNQLAFDMARGLPLASLVHAAAVGDDARVTALVDAANRSGARDDLVFCNRFGMQMILRAQRLAGSIPEAEVIRWRVWRDRHRHVTVDPTSAPGDMMPAVVDVATQLVHAARYPRSFVRQFVLNR